MFIFSITTKILSLLFKFFIIKLQSLSYNDRIKSFLFDKEFTNSYELSSTISLKSFFNSNPIMINI